MKPPSSSRFCCHTSTKNRFFQLQQAISSSDDDARSQFGTKEYWDELYLGRGDFPSDEYSWYYDWGGYGSYVKE